MKKLIIASVITFASISVFAKEQCSNADILNKSAVGVAAGAAAALLIPGIGPVLTIGGLAGSVTAAANVGVCAYKEGQKELQRAEMIEQFVSKIPGYEPEPQTYSEDLRRRFLKLF